MTNKAYIVANEQQEHEVLEKLEQEGLSWNTGNKPTEFKPAKDSYILDGFPYALTVNSYVGWASLYQLSDEEIVFDGRKEEQMSEKYVVSQEFMNELEEWKQSYFNDDLMFVDGDTIDCLPIVVNAWWGGEVSDEENNNRLIAIIRWVNGEDVFEVEKWVVRSKEVNDDGDKHYWKLLNLRGVLEVTSTFELRFATKFDTKEEAESWANAHQEVVEVVDV